MTNTRPDKFERKGDWPHMGGSFVRQSDGGLKPREAAEEANGRPPVDTETQPAKTIRGTTASKDDGK